jgi:hypothetical protein
MDVILLMGGSDMKKQVTGYIHKWYTTYGKDKWLDWRTCLMENDPRGGFLRLPDAIEKNKTKDMVKITLTVEVEEEVI